MKRPYKNIMTKEEKIAEVETYLVRLRTALDAIPAGVTSFSAFGLTGNFDRESLLREIRATEYQLERLKNQDEPRVFSIGWFS